MDNTLDWLDQSRQGDREAFAKIVGRYQGMVSAVTLNVVGDGMQSEDLAQETFLTVWKNLAELREPEKLGAWIYGIARRTALNWIERQRRSPLHGAREIDAAAVDPRFERDEARQKSEQSLQWVWSVVRELPESYREPLLLYYRYSKSAADIAALLDLTEDAVCQRLSRGRKILKAEIEKQVESVLETTKPDTAFTLAVLASLPLATAASGCTGVGTLAGGVHGGWSVFWTVGFFLLAPAILVTGGFLGLWTALKHSPTVRTRRFMCRAALQWYLFLWGFMIVKLMVDRGHGGWDQSGGVFFFSFYAIIVAYCAWLTYRWRTLLEEDAGLRPAPAKPLEKTSLSRFWLRCWNGGTMLPVCYLSVATVFGISRDFRSDPHFDEIFGIWGTPFLVAIGALWISIPLGFFLVVGYGLRTAKDEESLQRWSPKNGRAFLPKPEEATRWPLFRFDLAVLFLTTILPMIFLVIQGLVIDGLVAWVLISTMFMVVATLIASHSAGIPGRRLGGYARLWMIVGLLYAVLLMTGRGSYTWIPLGFGWAVPLPIVFVLVYFGAATALFIAKRGKTV